MKKKRAASVFFIAVFLIILYFGLFPYPMGRELVAKPAWCLDLSGVQPGAAAPASAVPAAQGGEQADAPRSVFPFRLGGLFGYLGSDGTLIRSERTLFGVALSEAGSINYTRVGTDWIMLDPKGQRLLSFSGNGYPVLSADGSRMLIAGSDLAGLVDVDGNGDTAWSREFPAVITSLSIQDDYLLVGLLNGTIQLLNRHGVPVYQGAPGGSRIAVVYGCSVSANGDLIAVVSGIGPQMLTVLAKSASTFTVLEKSVIPTDFRREVRTRFSNDSRYLVYEKESGAGLFDPEEKRFSSIALPGTLAGMAFLRQGRITALASIDANRVALRVVRPFVAGISSETFSAADLFVGTIDGQLLLGIDGRLLRVNVEAL